MAWSTWGSRGEATLATGPPLSSHLKETLEAGLFLLEAFSPPLLVFSSMFVWVLFCFNPHPRMCPLTLGRGGGEKRERETDGKEKR